jgi:Cu/Ag efflux protein CusF
MPITGLKAARTAFVATAIALSLCACLSACSSKSEPEATEAGGVVEYTVRGQVVDVVDDPVNGPTARIHHEPIPSFESQGEIVGMHAMTMPFPLAEGLDATALTSGAIIEFSFRVSYSAESQLAESWELTEFTVLPETTELIFDGDTSMEPSHIDAADDETPED